MNIFHIVENLDKGAVENWLVSIFLESRSYRPDWNWTFYCILGKEGRLDEAVRKAGGEIIYAPCWLDEKVKFLRHLRSALKARQYDILHVHHDYLSGFYLTASFGLAFKKRILHIHNTDKSLPVGNARVRQLLLGPLRRIALNMSDMVVGISSDTLQEFLKGVHVKEGKVKVLYYGIDLGRFAEDPSPGWLHRELDIPEDNKILLFAGRMNDLKNPGFVVEVLKELMTFREDVVAVFVGEGGKKQEVIENSRKYNIGDRIRLAGWRNDLALIMKQSDLFIFPRVEYPKEGLGLVVVEAQSAGLPMILSHGIVPDAIIIPELAYTISLKDNSREWAETVDLALKKGKPISAGAALQKMEESCFSLHNGMKNLVVLYEE